MPMNWNEAADAKLFAGVLATSEGGVKLKYEALAEWMGDGCTAKAIQHRISAVRKMTKDTVTHSPAQDTKTPKTNGKRKATNAKDVDATGSSEESPNKAKKATPKKVDIVAEDEEEVEIEDAGLIGEDA